MAQNLQAADKRKIEGLYLSDVKPNEIARQLGKKPATIRQYVYRQGLTGRRNEIEIAKRRTAREVLESVRGQHVEELATVLGMTGEGLKIDAERLRDGWGMVTTAADASSLMRAKSLLLDQTLRFHGVEGSERDRTSGNALLFLGDFVCAEPAAKPESKQVCEIPAEN